MTPILRLSDRICQGRGKFWPRDLLGLTAAIGKAEKFFFDMDLRQALSLKGGECPGDYHLHCPYRIFWLENPFNYQVKNLGLTGHLIRATESYSRGLVYHFIEMNDEIVMMSLGTKFDFEGAGWPAKEVEDKFRLTILEDNVANVPTVPFMLMDKPVGDDDIDQWNQHNDIWVTFFVGFLFSLNTKKLIIERDDFSEYNKLRRRLGQPKKQLQEHHHVRLIIEDDKTIFHTGQTQSHASPGEHDVRSHLRYHKNGRISKVKEHKRGNGPLRSKRLGYEVTTPSTITILGGNQ